MEYRLKLSSCIVPLIGAALVWSVSGNVVITVAVFFALLLPAFIAIYIPYAKDNPKHLWFKRKLYGWGWTPVTWQGWLVTVLFVGLVVIFSFTIDEESSNWELFATFIFPVILLTIAFIRVAARTGESPRWQWGVKKEDTNDISHQP